MMMVMMIMMMVVPWKHTCQDDEDDILRRLHIPVIMTNIISLYCVYTSQAGYGINITSVHNERLFIKYRINNKFFHQNSEYIVIKEKLGT